jgi:predicted ester cyclase
MKNKLIIASALMLSFFYCGTIFAQHSTVKKSNLKTMDYSELIRKHASEFHRNFSTGDFDKNGPLVDPKIYVNSNAAIVIGRDKFVERIKRYHTPFPKLQLKDRIVLVDGNVVGLWYVLQGTQDGPYGTIPASGNKVNVYAAEFFTMDDKGLMKELLTITQLGRLVKQIKGEEKVAAYEKIELLPIKKTDAPYKKMLKDNIEAYVADFNTRDWNALNNLLADDVHVAWNGKEGVGKQAVQDGMSMYTTAMPDLTWHLDRNVVEGDRGALAYTLNGHTEKMGADGIPMSKAVEAREGVHLQFNEKGKIINVVVISNSDEIEAQIK